MKGRVPLTLAAAIVTLAGLAAACDNDTQTSPTPTMSAGTISAPGSLTITYAHLPGDIRAPTDCQALPPYIPWTLMFTGEADASFNVFTGTMTPGGAATLTRCTGPYGC